MGLHRVIEPVGVLPQAAWRLDTSPDIADDELRIRVERLNLDAASFRQLRDKHAGAGAAVRAEVREIIGRRGKMHNPVTGSGGMLIGTVEAVGPAATAPVRVGDRVASLVSLTLTPLAVDDDLAGWDGLSEQVPCAGHAILFGRTVVAALPADLPDRYALAVLDVCGAPALTDRVVRAQRPADARAGVRVAVLGGAGKSGALALAAARRAGAGRTVGVVPTVAERDRLVSAGLVSAVVVADARDPVAVSAAVREALGAAADVTVVCVDVPGCEHGAVLATADAGTVVFFSMATSFAAAALGAEGLAADVTMLVGNGYVPGHARMALDLFAAEPGVRGLFEARLAAD
ncbi:zinc-binding alcohol dehydrogenase [Solwaraspora sp. WMMD406]|uniref:L-erythro-3,5-diaminohexanoate dehydrogenase n=1 Tax=Solwaraspora sp. WMMD406 TaxID=3016095 RepID=UPI0024166876|nr:zinc-binding alcohol dehydrogenase [Solwaraspora sp. WMMD406]MDG4766205.1 zinc-binding alcohol dehydrogenase [Solwaraspora sp. WMMD406]MDG4768676.1 zinc-binding alcohol dehydrogenase [Solwaraspora sp. WMMD406]